MGARLNSEWNNGSTVFHDNYFPLRIGGIRMQHVYADRRFRLVILVTRCLPSFSASPSICLPISSSFIIGIRTIPSRADSFHYVRSTWPYVRTYVQATCFRTKLPTPCSIVRPTRYFSSIAPRDIISLYSRPRWSWYSLSFFISIQFYLCPLHNWSGTVNYKIETEFPLHFSKPSSRRVSPTRIHLFAIDECASRSRLDKLIVVRITNDAIRNYFSESVAVLIPEPKRRGIQSSHSFILYN